MKNINALIIRNIKLFLRDKSAVFFSFLSSIILIALYILFIGKSYTDAIISYLPDLTLPQAQFLIYLQMMAGVLVINSISLSLGMFSIMAKDIETQKSNSFLITPIKKYQLLTAYLISALLISLVLNTLTWIITVILIGIITGYYLSFLATLLGILILVFASLVSCGLMMLITVIAKSSTALGVINGIIGTFLGFICGIYMPFSSLGNGVKMVASLLPFTHITIWFKSMVLSNGYHIFDINTNSQYWFNEMIFSANNVGLLGFKVDLIIMLGLSLVFAIICFSLATFILKRNSYIK